MMHLTEVAFSSGTQCRLQNVSLTVKRGEVLGLVGPNGAGKSTLLRLMAGLERPSAGSILVQGQSLTTYSPQQRARLLAWLPQVGQVPLGMHVRDIVALGRLPQKSERPEVVQHCLQQTGLTELAHRLGSTLSGGEKARMFLARALAVDVSLLLADEPVAALDPAQALMMMELFRQQARLGKSCVVVLHDLALAARFCDRIGVIHQGRLVGVGTPRKVLSPENLERVFGVAVRYVEEVPVVWSRLSSASA